MWTRRRTKIGSRMHPDDWTILRDGEPVGRVFLEWRTNPLRQEWKWCKHVGFTVPNHGWTSDLSLGCEAVRQAVLEEDQSSDVG